MIRNWNKEKYPGAFFVIYHQWNIIDADKCGNWSYYQPSWFTYNSYHAQTEEYLKCDWTRSVHRSIFIYVRVAWISGGRSPSHFGNSNIEEKRFCCRRGQSVGMFMFAIPISLISIWRSRISIYRTVESHPVPRPVRTQEYLTSNTVNVMITPIKSQ